MATKRFIKNCRRNSKTRKVGGKHSKSGKKWITAIEAAQKTLKKTNSLQAAKSSLRKQALYNARKLFGSI
uniref:Uncharacterized protein n=1 Tax=viral metagenome TaxID=1070528 RepID=A0A6C0ART3_9ZZZZ